MELIKRNARRGDAVLIYDPERRKSPLMLQRQLEYFGFELERESHPVNDFPPDLAQRARHVIAESLAKFEARHPAVKRNRAAIEEVREVYRRSGGETPKLGLPELTALYEEQLADVYSLDELRAAQLRLDLDALVPPEVRARYLALPGSVMVRDREVEIDYDVEERDGSKRGVARLRLPEKLARTLSEDELPVLDREVRFVVPRGQRGSVRAATLDELRELLDRPWTDEEVERHERKREERAKQREDEHRHRRTREAASDFRRGRPGSRTGGPRGGGGEGSGGRRGGGAKRGGRPGGRGRSGGKRSG
jgi:hypothetical protein